MLWEERWLQEIKELYDHEHLRKTTDEVSFSGELENWGQGCVIFGERKNKERKGETPLRRRKYFE